MAGRSVDDDEWKEVRLSQQAQATILSRLQFELEGHLADSVVQAEQHAKYVMDPEIGVVVKANRLEADCKALKKRLDADAEARMERRRWAWRDLLLPTVASVLAAVLAALLTAWALGGQG